MYQTLLATLLFIGALGISAQQVIATPVKQQLPQQDIQWQNYDQALLQAKQLKRPIYLQFHANWCIYCKKLAKESYSQPEIQKLLNEEFVPVQIVEDSKATYTIQGKTYTVQDILTEYKVTGFPTLAFFEEDGSLIGLVPGYVAPDDFKLLLMFIANKAYLTSDFDTYRKTNK